MLINYTVRRRYCATVWKCSRISSEDYEKKLVCFEEYRKVKIIDINTNKTKTVIFNKRKVNVIRIVWYMEKVSKQFILTATLVYFSITTVDVLPARKKNSLIRHSRHQGHRSLAVYALYRKIRNRCFPSTWFAAKTFLTH